MDGYVSSQAQYIMPKLTLHGMGLTAAEQREFQSRMERKQMKEFMGVRTSLALQFLLNSLPK